MREIPSFKSTDKLSVWPDRRSLGQSNHSSRIACRLSPGFTPRICGRQTTVVNPWFNHCRPIISVSSHSGALIQFWKGRRNHELRIHILIRGLVVAAAASAPGKSESTVLPTNINRLIWSGEGGRIWGGHCPMMGNAQQHRLQVAGRIVSGWKHLLAGRILSAWIISDRQSNQKVSMSIVSPSFFLHRRQVASLFRSSMAILNPRLSASHRDIMTELSFPVLSPTTFASRSSIYQGMLMSKINAFARVSATWFARIKSTIKQNPCLLFLFMFSSHRKHPAANAMMSQLADTFMVLHRFCQGAMAHDDSFGYARCTGTLKLIVWQIVES